MDKHCYALLYIHVTGATFHILSDIFKAQKLPAGELKEFQNDYIYSSFEPNLLMNLIVPRPVPTKDEFCETIIEKLQLLVTLPRTALLQIVDNSLVWSYYTLSQLAEPIDLIYLIKAYVKFYQTVAENSMTSTICIRTFEDICRVRFYRLSNQQLRLVLNFATNVLGDYNGSIPTDLKTAWAFLQFNSKYKSEYVLPCVTRPFPMTMRQPGSIEIDPESHMLQYMFQYAADTIRDRAQGSLENHKSFLESIAQHSLQVKLPSYSTVVVNRPPLYSPEQLLNHSTREENKILEPPKKNVAPVMLKTLGSMFQSSKAFNSSTGILDWMQIDEPVAPKRLQTIESDKELCLSEQRIKSLMAAQQLKDSASPVSTQSNTEFASTMKAYRTSLVPKAQSSTVENSAVPEVFRLPGQLKSNPHARSKRIRDEIRRNIKPDICALQEVWGPGYNYLNDNLLDPECKDEHEYSHTWDYLYTARQFLNKSGGLALRSTPSIPQLQKWSHTFTVSATKSNKGIIAVLYDVGQYWPGKRLLICNTHLDAFHEANKKQQISEIGTFLQKIAVNASLDGSSGIVVAGDFNCPDSLPIYENNVMRTCGPKGNMVDMFKEFAPQVAEQPTFDVGVNKLATLSVGPCRIDYIFNVHQLENVNSSFLRLKASDCKLIKQEDEFSDHWGLSCNLVPY